MRPVRPRRRCCRQELTFAPVPNVVHAVAEDVRLAASRAFLQCDVAKRLLNILRSATKPRLAGLAVLVLEVDIHVGTGFAVEEHLAIIRSAACTHTQHAHPS